MSESSVQTVVIGAGVVGLACAAELARKGREVFVLERENAIGQGVSSRNSEVIHAGIYYTPGSLKAQLCVRGRELLYDYAEDRQINASRIGKLIVATSESENAKLDLLAARAKENGVADLKKIDRATALAMQPGLQCTAALHSPSTGIIDSHSLMISLVADIEQHGGAVVCRAPVEAINVNASGDLNVTVGGEDPMTLECSEIINSTGLNAVSLARQTSGLAAESVPRARFAKGNYFRLQGKAPFSMLIYPAPVDGGLGVHLTLDHGSQARFGPDVQWLDDAGHTDNSQNPHGNAEFNYEVDPSRADSFYSAIRRYWPALPDNSLLADYSGVRPKAFYNDGDEVDFHISTPAQHGIPGLVNLYGIESPGLTSSLAIAERVAQALDN